MIALLQRVKEASVGIEERVISGINRGIVVFLGIRFDDTEVDCKHLVSKILKLRIFEDKNNKMNLSCNDIGSEILVVSEFTLIAETQRGNRPSFSNAADKEKAQRMYNYFIDLLNESGLDVKEGQFAKHMQVTIVNDGPITFILNSKIQMSKSK